MNPHWLVLDAWLVRSALGGGLLLLLAWAVMHALRQPARRQRLGEWAALAGIFLAALSLLPAWLTVAYSVPMESPAAPVAEFAALQETAASSADDSDTLLAAALLAEQPLDDVPAETGANPTLSQLPAAPE